MLFAFSPLLGETSNGFIVVLVILGLLGLTFLFVIGRFINLWIQAFSSGAGVSMISLIGMYLRKVDMRTITLAKIQLVKAKVQ